MIVYLNDDTITLFKGAKVKHLLLKADEALYRKVLSREASVVDQEGNEVDMGGAVSGGWHYYVK